LVQGLAKQAEAAGDQITKYFEELIEPYKAFDGFVMTDLKDHPLINGLYNRLESISKDLRRIVRSKDLDLIDSINSFRVEKIDRIVAMKRDSSRLFISMDQL
jgi:hypothetical protein